MTIPREDEENFGFGFNDNAFSDRVLHIEITTACSNDSDCCVKIEVMSLHVNSIILAAKSPFFYKLFKNGMIESQRQDMTLKIDSSEKSALLDLLNFMYHKSLSATTYSDLVDVLIVADKFQVISCMRYCIDLLLKMTMSLESALSYLELPPTVLVAQVVQPLIDASKQYLFTRYKDFSNSLEDAMELSLLGLEFVLGIEGLQVDSEDDVFEFLLKWGRAYFSELKERQEVLTKRLVRFICFPYMSSSKLKEVLSCPEFNDEEVSKLVMEALFYKIDVLSDNDNHTSKDLVRSKGSLPGRLYHDRLVKVAPLDFPLPRRVVYYNLKKEECENLFSSTEGLYSRSFLLGGRWFNLQARCIKEQYSSIKHFGLYEGMRKGSETCTLQIEFAVMKKSSKKFEMQQHTNGCVLTDVSAKGWPDLFRIPWTTFISDDSDYFIDGILHLRVDLTIINSHSR